ncbi:MAG TPA: tetratricopeptide repeat protein, partial [Acidobacteriaceae bacterium]
MSGNTTMGWPAASDLRMRELEELANETYQKENETPPAMRNKTITCILQPYPGLSNTVALRSLEVPEKVHNEYQKACTALQSEKLPEAEKHLRKALQLYSSDPLGWVMLGRLLEAKQGWDEARQACSEAAVHNPSYWPADVCIAEIDAQQQKWSDSL